MTTTGRSIAARGGVGVALTLVAVLLLPVTAANAAPGDVLAAGSNASGQLGSSGTTSSTVPVLSAVPAAEQIASGRDHGYALDGSGSVWAWGENGKGQVGDGTTTDRSTPVRLPLQGVVQVEAGHYHGLALTSDGRVWTWGFGRLGQLGLGTTVNRKVPTLVPGLTDVVHVAGGRDASYAVGADGRVWSWGSNALGELGDPGRTTTPSTTRPALVPGVGSVTELGVGRNHVLAQTSTGEVWAWGANDYGQIGDGTTTRRPTAVRVITADAGAAVAHVDAGAHHSVVVTRTGVVRTWGRGYRGQLGIGTTRVRSAPVTVTGLPPVVEVGDGRDQTFAVDADGRVWSWGDNTAGQLGDGSTTRRTRPVVLPVTGVSAVQGGSRHTLFLTGP